MNTINSALSRIESVSEDARKRARYRLDNLTKPKGSLGSLEDIAERYAAIRGIDNLKLKKKIIFTFAGDHGVSEEGVSAFPKEVTAQMVLNFLNGGAAINVLARHNNIDIIVVDMGVDYEFSADEKGLIVKKIARGTENFTKGTAMTKGQAIEAVKAGIGIADEWSEKDIDIIGTGDMGIANTASSSAIFAAISGRALEEVTGRGTGIDDEALRLKINVIKKSLEINRPDADDPIDVLAKVGGFEIGGIAGLIIGAAANNIPVVIDGFISAAGALIAIKLEPKIKDYLFMSHKSVEAGHSVFFDIIGQRPLLDLNMRLGEGTGAAIGIGLVEASVKLLNEMATFEEAKVSEGTSEKEG